MLDYNVLHKFCKGNAIDYEGFPLLLHLCKFKKKSPHIESFFSLEDLLPEIELEFIDFFKHDSLKSALKTHFGISSPIVTNFFQTQILSEDKKLVKINLNYFLSLDVLSHVFIKVDKSNHDSFLKALQSNKILALLGPLYNKRIQFSGFLNSVYSEEQKIKVLENSTISDQPTDTLDMYFQNTEYFLNKLNNLPFHMKDSIEKCHDIFAKEMAKLKTINFPLNQVDHYPQIKSLNEINKKFKFTIPESYHDLIDWGSALGHCIGSHAYAKKAATGESLLLGVHKQDQVAYTLEIKMAKLVQIQGISGTKPDPSLLNEISKELKKHKLLT